MLKHGFLNRIYIMKQTTLSIISNCSRSLSRVAAEKDFFGIAHITTKDIAGNPSGTKLVGDTLQSKYQPLSQPRKALEKDVREVNATFGTLRFDRENVPKRHGQFEPSNDKRMFETVDIKQKYVPLENQSEVSEQDIIEEPLREEPWSGMGEKPRKIVDIEAESSFAEVLELFKIPNVAQQHIKYNNQPPLIFFFENSRKTIDSQEENSIDEDGAQQLSNNELKLSGRRLNEDEIQESILEASFQVDVNPPLEYDPKKDLTPIEELDPDSEEYHTRNEEVMKDFDFDKTIDQMYDHSPDVKKKGLGALDYLKQVRAGKIEPSNEGLRKRMETNELSTFKPVISLDSQGYRNYSYQVPNWHKFRHIDILNYLKRSIVYNNYDILAVNKPYGIASHEEDKNREPFDMNSLMHEVAKEMKIEKIYLAHRLDKTTTGLLLFATSKQRANNLNKLFKSEQIKKTYWCITKGIPDPDQGIIDIPIGEFAVAGKARSCLAPEKIDERMQLSKKYRAARRAITEYKVIDAQKHVALVEVKPRTGVKHQIRTHLSFGLNCPILGDHKYSHIGKVAPQLLQVPVLKALQLRQAKVRTLPMHLHSKLAVIPGAKANGETLFISAPLPAHFTANLRSLKLNVDSKL